MLRPIRIAAPAEPLLTLDDVKEWGRHDSILEPVTFAACISAATDLLDGWNGILGRCLVTQTWAWETSNMVGRYLDLPFPDVSEVILDAYSATPVRELVYDTGSLTSVGPGVFCTDAYLSGAEPGATSCRLEERNRCTRLRLEGVAPRVPAQESEGAVRVIMTAGYGAPGDVPGGIRVAAFLLAQNWAENREAAVVGTMVSTLPYTVRSLLAPHAVGGI
ncbi:phage gp6-like head-tail connector protein [Paroceanicella profunda]|uniref:Phage gp6-like head-tail connector protein n=1 Tax=Paroceanicella profunda TaxID=2579971 RepID=A0A5B8G1W4_9RHOB|nr:head-tail connector protein [Paroceanicella profunda]QDL92543.1 phage gp6-like head-tail connector protein [Paroceanicella profunda]